MDYTWETRPAIVAQISNPLYRRFPIGRPSPRPTRLNFPGVCGLKTRDTADWKSALRGLQRLQMCSVSYGLLSRLAGDPRASTRHQNEPTGE